MECAIVLPQYLLQYFFSRQSLCEGLGSYSMICCLWDGDKTGIYGVFDTIFFVFHSYYYSYTARL